MDMTKAAQVLTWRGGPTRHLGQVATLPNNARTGDTCVVEDEYCIYVYDEDARVWWKS